MGGGLMQLVAYGAQDIYLTGNPQITFFKVVYRRHTNFSMESILQTFNGTADFGGDVSATISRNGDLVYRMYLEHDVLFTSAASTSTYINICSNYGSNLIKECELEIGGQKIDKHYSHWHSVYSQLTEFNPSGAFNNGIDHKATSRADLTDGSVVKSTLFNTMSGNGGAVTTGINATNDIVATLGSWTIGADGNGGEADTAQTKIFVPLYFWFCRNPGLALPLIALQYHEVKVKMTFETSINLACDVVESGGTPDDLLGGGNAGKQAFTASTPTGKGFNLWCDYIYLDTDERRRFAQVSHEYLIEQLQFQSYSSAATLDLNFNHPVKELIWTSAKNAGGHLGSTSISNFIGVGGAATTVTQPQQIVLTSNREPKTLSGVFQLKLNGHDRFKERDSRYFTRTQVWEHHTGYGSTINSDAIAVYSFALKPEEHQPSGTCNFSRIDNAQLTATSGDYNVYAVNYNVLRIMSGMGGLAYSN
jgi:hypothetical protein